VVLSEIKVTIIMETEESKSGISMIKPTYDEIKESLGERLKKYEIDDESLAEFSIYIERR